MYRLSPLFLFFDDRQTNCSLTRCFVARHVCGSILQRSQYSLVVSLAARFCLLQLLESSDLYGDLRANLKQTQSVIQRGVTSRNASPDFIAFQITLNERAMHLLLQENVNRFER